MKEVVMSNMAKYLQSRSAAHSCCHQTGGVSEWTEGQEVCRAHYNWLIAHVRIHCELK